MAPPAGPIPPPLPPSVEESYRRKCIQLKQRMNEVEDANAASVVRLSRMKRGIEKLRLERAFLLEQLAKRTSTNVEDSEGSPSPPPTPKEKPLRTKRGHRKPSFLANLDTTTRGSSTFLQGNQAITLSPSNSDAFSHTQSAAPRPLAPSTNGTKPPLAAETQRRPRNPFELFAHENRQGLLAANTTASTAGTYDVDKDLATKWQEMGREGQDPYHHRFETGNYTFNPGQAPPSSQTQENRQEDVEMGDEGDEDDMYE